MKLESQQDFAIDPPVLQNLESFKANLLQLNEQLSRMGVCSAAAFSAKSFEHFQNLSDEKRNTIISQIQKTRHLYQNISQNSPESASTPDLICEALKALNLTTVPEAYTHLDAEDVFEIYNKDHTQIFRSPRFLHYCSYSLADLYVQTWQELYSRPLHIKALSEQYAISCLTEKKVLRPEFPPYYLLELHSPLQKLFVLKVISFAPIFHLDGSPFGFMRTLREGIRFGQIRNIADIQYRTQLTLGKYLSSKRLLKRLSLFQVAEYIQESNLFVKELEQDHAFPSGPHLIKLSSLYGVAIEDILEFLTLHAQF